MDDHAATNIKYLENFNDDCLIQAVEENLECCNYP